MKSPNQCKCGEYLNYGNMSGRCYRCNKAYHNRLNNASARKDLPPVTTHEFKELSDAEVVSHFKSLVQFHGGGFVPIYPCKVIEPGHPEWAKLERKYSGGAI